MSAALLARKQNLKAKGGNKIGIWDGRTLALPLF